jgi:hypothetical protein
VDGIGEEMEIDNDKTDGISIDSDVEKALEVTSSFKNDNKPQNTKPKQDKVRSDHSNSDSSSNVLSSEEDLAAERHANRSKQKLQAPQAAVARRCSARCK